MLEAGARRRGAASCAASTPGRIHLLLTDVVMPRDERPQLAERLRADEPGLRVLYISGYTDDAIVLARRLPPGTAFVQKPLNS